MKGPSITPRSPQGQPLVTALAHQTIPYELAATSADLVFVTPHDDEQAASILGEVRDAEARVGREGRPLSVLADVVVLLEATARARRRRARTARRLARRARDIRRPDLRRHPRGARRAASAPGPTLGYDGVRLRPARLTRDLDQVAEWVLPAFDRADAAGTTLRERLGFERPANRYAVEETAA